MRKFFKGMMVFFENYSRARAASEFTRMGRPDLARNLMIWENKHV